MNVHGTEYEMAHKTECRMEHGTEGTTAHEMKCEAVHKKEQRG